MFQQSILDSLSEIWGRPLEWEELAGLTPGNIASQYARYFDIEEKDLSPAMFPTITPEQIRATQYTTYRPQIEAKGGALLTDLQKQLSGKSGMQAFGGFAGSGQSQQFTEGAKDVYGQGMSGILATSGQQRAQGLQSVQDVINQWVETASDIKGW